MNRYGFRVKRRRGITAGRFLNTRGRGSKRNRRVYRSLIRSSGKYSNFS